MILSANRANFGYKADITAGALKLPESRLIADLLLRQVDADTALIAILQPVEAAKVKPKSQTNGLWSQENTGA